MRTPITVFLVFTAAFLCMMESVAQDAELLYEEIIRVTAPSTVNVRDEASTRNPAIATLRAGETVTVLEAIPEGEAVSGNMLWYRIVLNDGREGFIWSGAVGELQIDRTCIRSIPAAPEDIWLAIRERAMPLLAWNVDRQRLVAQGNTGDERLLWATLASPEEVNGLNGLSETLTVSAVLDLENCQEVGAIVDNNGFPFYAVKETPYSSEIKFINATYVIETRRATAEEYQSIQQAIREHTAAANAISAANEARRSLLTGERIAFVGVLPGTRNSSYARQRIYLVSPFTGAIDRLTDNPDTAYYENNPRWSPDGTTVVYQYSTGNITVTFYSLLDERQRRLLEDRNTSFGVVAGSWSPEGDMLAVFRIVYLSGGGGRGNEDIGIMSADISTIGYDSLDLFTTDFSTGDGQQYRDFSFLPYWSPIENVIAIAALEESQYGLYLINIDTRLIERTGTGIPLSWSPDGRKLLSLNSSDDYRTVTFSVVEVASQDAISLTPKPIPYTYAAYPVWSPDGRQIALPYQEEDQPYASLYVVDEATWNWRQLTTDLIVRGIAWSPDGDQLVFVGRQPNAVDEYEALYIINADGTNQHLLVDGIDYYSDLVWLPAIDN